VLLRFDSASACLLMFGFIKKIVIGRTIMGGFILVTLKLLLVMRICVQVNFFAPANSFKVI